MSFRTAGGITRRGGKESLSCPHQPSYASYRIFQTLYPNTLIISDVTNRRRRGYYQVFFLCYTMKSMRLLLVLFFVIPTISVSQPLIEKSFSFSGILTVTGSVPLPDGSAITCGYIVDLFGTTSQDFVFKVTATGSLSWAKTISDASSSLTAESIFPAADGSFIITGTKGGAPPESYVIAITAEGEILWSNSYSCGQNTEILSGYALSDSGSLLLGYLYPHTPGVIDSSFGFALKLANNGAVQWCYVFTANVDSIQQTYLYRAVEFPDSSIVVCGSTGVSSVVGNQDVFLLRLDRTGSILNTGVYHSESAAVLPTTLSRTSDNKLLFSCTADGKLQQPILMRLADIDKPLWCNIYQSFSDEFTLAAYEDTPGELIFFSQAAVTDGPTQFMFRIDTSGQLKAIAAIADLHTSPTTVFPVAPDRYGLLGSGQGGITLMTVSHGFEGCTVSASLGSAAPFTLVSAPVTYRTSALSPVRNELSVSTATITLAETTICSTAMNVNASRRYPGHGSIYPNPVMNAQAITFGIYDAQPGLYSASIYNVLGQECLRTSVGIASGGTQINLSTSALADGTYILELKDLRGETVTTGEFVVQKKK